MGKPTGFLEIDRKAGIKRPVKERIQDYKEFESNLSHDELEGQASRCMDCGIPTCHIFGCPAKNRIPDWNDLIYKGHWKRALTILHSTNNFPEFTGRVCPAPCEPACTLSINRESISIRQIEKQIVERGWEEGWIQPQPSTLNTRKRIAIVGSGPAGLAAAQQLVRKGYDVIVFEKDDRIAGDVIPEKEEISAKGKHVVVIGGGDTGSDCIGTSIRQGAASVTHIYYQDIPPEERPLCNPWPEWPKTFRTSSSQEEGCNRFWKYMTKAFVGENDSLTGIKVAELEWTRPKHGSRGTYTEKTNSEKIIRADLAFLSIGFQHCEHGPLLTDLKLEFDKRGNIKKDDNMMTNLPGIFVAGDAELGASLVVSAIFSGRQAAEGVHQYLSAERTLKK